MTFFEVGLSPIVWLMEQVLDFYNDLFNSMGASILMLSATFSVLLTPLLKHANKIEKRLSSKILEVENEVLEHKGNLKGEALFLETEKIYQKHNYHPIHKVGLGISFFYMLPVLISAIILFSNSELVIGQSFGPISDLSKPDALAHVVNILPFLMLLITALDARIRFRDDPKSRLRFYVLSVVLLVIVYDLPSGLVLYWIGNNITSMLSYLAFSKEPRV